MCCCCGYYPLCCHLALDRGARAGAFQGGAGGILLDEDEEEDDDEDEQEVAGWASAPSERPEPDTRVVRRAD